MGRPAIGTPPRYLAAPMANPSPTLPTQAEIHQLVDPYDYFAAMTGGKRMERIFHPRRQRLVVGALPWAGLRVLEVGCGTGCMLAALAAEKADVVGCELSFEHLLTARGHLAGLGMDVPVLQADGERLPFLDSSFDVVLLSDLVEHNPFPAPLLHEAERVCKPEGRLLLGGPWQRHPKAMDWVKHLLSGKKHGAPDFDYDTPRLRRLLSRSVLIDERYDYFIGWYLSLWAPRHKGAPAAV